jgi:predicted NAD/FAD-binding protein
VYKAEDTQKVVVEHQNGTKQFFDDVVISTEAFAALKLLRSPTPEQTQALSSFPYEVSSVCMHTDQSLMPKVQCHLQSIY